MRSILRTLISFLFFLLLSELLWGVKILADEPEAPMAISQEDVTLMVHLFREKGVNAGSGPKYCSGYLCANFAVDECTQIGTENCRILSLTDKDRNGHSVNVIRVY